MSSSTEYGVRTIINPEDESRRVPFFCPVCDLSMRTSSDYDSYRVFGCCADCRRDFVEPNRKEWERGWRPSADEIRERLAMTNGEFDVKLG